MLVLLRVSVGWHFLYQGVWKLENPTFSSRGFLSHAKGPLADEFHKLIPDYDGRQRLDDEHRLGALNNYHSSFSKHFKLGPEQKEAAERVLVHRKAQVEQYFADYQEDIDTYWHEWDLLERAKQEPSRNMPFEQRRNWNKESELRGRAGVWGTDLEKMADEFKQDLDRLLDEDQRQRGNIPQPLTSTFDMDDLITFSNIVIGVCLIVGLFTRLAALCGGVFMGLVVLAQPDWPGLYPPPHPLAGHSLIVNKEFIEMMALFVLATTRVGRWGGLDFFVHHLLVRPVFGRKAAT
jgi:uncharacterized membrane protein YphA (DoxX/SURF4 family)